MAPTSTVTILTRNDSAAEISEEMVFKDGEKGKRMRGPLDLAVLGVHCRPSLGGVGCALVRYRRESFEEPLHLSLLQYDEIAVPLPIRVPILNLLRDDLTPPRAVLQANSMLGHMFSTAVKGFCNTHNVPLGSIDLIGAYADTVPPLSMPPSASLTSTESKHPPQSWSALLASDTGITTVTHSRSTKEQSARRATSPDSFIDSLLLQHPTKFRVCLTIADILNTSIIPSSSAAIPRAPFNSDGGPGTMFIDYAMRYTTSNQLEHDHDGSYGAQGTVNDNVVARFLDAHDYTNHAPPLDITTEMFGDHEAQALIDECLFLGMSDHDTIATVTRITASNIARQYRRIMTGLFPPSQQVDEIFICGPGARNAAIMDFLRSKDVLPATVSVRALEDIGIPGDAKDAVRAAQQGLEAVLAQSAMEKEPRGDGEIEWPVHSSCVVKGQRWEEVRKHVLSFSGGKLESPVQRLIVDRGMGGLVDGAINGVDGIHGTDGVNGVHLLN